MQRQTEITKPIQLLDGRGNLRRPGYSRTMVQEYRRQDVKASPLRRKEWDYYLVNNGRVALALTVADNGYMGMDSVSLLELEEGWEITRSPMQVMTLGRKGLPEHSGAGDVHASGRGYGIHFLHRGESRVLVAHMDKFGPQGTLTARVELTGEPPESMVIATPFGQDGCFYYNQKINCLRAKGYVTYGGRTWTFSPEDSFGVLDWGRGVWTRDNTWYWSSASGLAPDGETFGWNLGYGFGDTSAATENMLFYAGRAHKLGRVDFGIPGDGEGRPRYMEPWRFTSDDGRFQMEFAPVLDRAARTDLKVLSTSQHQVFGRFTGRAVLDGGQTVEVRDFPGFAEKVRNRW